MRWEEFTFIFLLVSGTNAQFGEIASLATSLLGGALGNGAGLGALAGAGAAGAGAAGQAGGALAQIGQLYQLAQGALQLTGTGVGVLNQASEGNWFPAVLEQTAKNSQALMKQGGGGGGLNLGALGPTPGKTGGAGIGPEFGTSFPAPNIDDYDENAEIPGVTEKKTPKTPDGLVDIEEEDYELETTKATTTTTDVTTTTTTELGPEEDGEETTTEPTTPQPRQIRIQLPDKDGKTDPEEDLDYEDLINKKSEKSQQVIPTIDAESTEELKRNVIATHGTKTQPVVPKLEKLVEVLQKSKLSKEEIDEIVAQVEGNRHIEKPAKYDFNAAVQNIPDKKNKIRQKITDASRIINSNFENQRKEQTIVIQKQVDEFKVLPDITDSSIAPVHITTTTTIAPKKTTTTTIASTTTVTTTKTATKPATTSKPVPTTTLSTIHVQQARSVPSAAPAPAPAPAPVQPAAVISQIAPQVAPQVQQPQPQQPFNNFWNPHNQFQQPFHQQQQFYYTQAPFYGQQTQNYWGQQQNQFNQQYGIQPHQLPHQQVHQQQQYGYTTAYPVQQPQPQQQQQQQQQQRQQQQQQQQQYYSQQYLARQNNYQPQPQQQYNQQTQYPNQQIARQPAPQPAAPVQHRPQVPPPAQQVVYQQGSAQPTVAPQKTVHSQPNGNNNQVVHYYNDGKQIVQQIIPKRIAANGNLPLNGPFQSQSTAPTDPAEYQRRQRALQQAYHQPQTRGAKVPQPAARVQPRIYESTVTATGHRQAHAIRTYQATKSASVTPPNPQPAAATRSSGRVNSSKKRYSGHVLPGPTIDHRSLIEKRTTAKPRYVRVP